MRSKIAGVLMALLFLTGCRDLNPLDARIVIDGYRVVGTVMDGLNNPIPGVQIRLSYGMDFVSGSPVPERSYTLQAQTEYVEVRVLDRTGTQVRALYADTVSAPTIYVPWDKLNDAAVPVPSGIYEVRYIVGGTVRHTYTVIVDGNITVTTSTEGVFVLPNEILPVGFYPAPLYSGNDSFLGNFVFQNLVRVQMSVGSTNYSQWIVVERNRITRVLVRVQ